MGSRRGRKPGWRKVNGYWKAPPEDIQVKSEPAMSQAFSSVPRPATCAVCYNEFSPFPMTCDKWESTMMKMFYHILNVGVGETSKSNQTNGPVAAGSLNGAQGGGGEPNGGNSSEEEEEDEDDSIISLPFCPQCHSKVSVMYSIHCQLQSTLRKFDSVRDSIAFTVVETIDKNSTKGPMDHIREQIFEKWNPRYVTMKEAGNIGTKIGLEMMAEKNYGGNITIDRSLFPPTPPPVRHVNKSEPRKVKKQPEHNSEFKEPTMGNSKQAVARHDVSSDNVESLLEMEIQDESIEEEEEEEEDANEEDYYNKLSLAPNQVHTLPQKRMSMQKGGGKKQQHSSEIRGVSPIPKMPKLIPMGRIASPKRPSKPSTSRGGGGGGRKSEPGEITDDYNDMELVIDEGETSETSSPDGKRRRIPKKAFTFVEKPKLSKGRRSSSPRKSVSLKSGQIKRPSSFQEPLDNGNEGNEDMPSFNNWESLNGENGPFKCNYCSASYHTLSLIRRHISISHPDKKEHRCKYCSKGFSTVLTLRRHVQQAHPTTLEGSLKCPYCSKCFIKKKAYDLHIKTMHKAAATAAVRARKTMLAQKRSKPTSNDALQPHSGTEESASSPMKIIKTEGLEMGAGGGGEEAGNELSVNVDNEPDSFDETTYEEEEEDEAQGGGPIECCGITFPFAGLRDQHMATHHKKTAYTCNFTGCTQTFTDQGEYKKHMKTHRKRLYCECKAYFYREETLIIHQKTCGKKAQESGPVDPVPEAPEPPAAELNEKSAEAPEAELNEKTTNSTDTTESPIEASSAVEEGGGESEDVSSEGKPPPAKKAKNNLKSKMESFM